MRVALLGTRGIPAQHGGFETAVQHIGPGLAQRGWDVTVYCRNPGQRLREFEGARLVNLPALRLKSAETLSHTALSSLHAMFGGYAVAIVFNSGNAPFVSPLRLRGIPVAVHVDGLEAERAKWEGMGAKYYTWAERAAVRRADAVIADARAIVDYVRERYGRESVYLPYGAHLVDPPTPRLTEVGLHADGYHLSVARFEPENHVLEIVRGYRRSAARLPLVVVGAASYSHDYAEAVARAAAGDDRIRLLGSVWDQVLLDQLYAGSRSLLHGHSVGGTNPSLLRAMGAGTRITAYDCVFNREVTGGHARWFTDEAEVARAVELDESAPDERGKPARQRAETAYRWDDVIDGYADLCYRLAR
ncbi:MAG TPA: glycosyltransferase [Actinomycetota bacterium]|nr:glycosyltransferase [Actinomycetota bacterium]